VTRLRVPFLSAALHEDAAAVRTAIERVVASGWFILGPEVDAFEHEFAEAAGARHAVGVGSGTDAIALALRALGIGRGDQVITTPLSAAYSALAIVMAGAEPVLADIDPARLTIDPAAIEAAITPRTRAIVPVHLYGQPADMAAIERLAAAHGLAIVEDCCQAHLARSAGRPVGTTGAAGAFSFYPTKNLAALGDGGAVVTGDAALAERIKRLRNGGQTDRYHHEELGVNTRLDEMQAAVLRARLSFLPRWTARRRELAAEYRRLLPGTAIAIPRQCDDGHVYHLFPVLVHGGGDARAALQRHLTTSGIDTLIHYPIPIHRQPAFAHLRAANVPHAEDACARVLSLPLHPALDGHAVAAVAETIRSWAHP
jgi:dTDP-3-amino-3,4,6-trideoxy-alpha-D-glucose transaminase